MKTLTTKRLVSFDKNRRAKSFHVSPCKGHRTRSGLISDAVLDDVLSKFGHQASIFRIYDYRPDDDEIETIQDALKIAKMSIKELQQNVDSIIAYYKTSNSYDRR